MSTLLEDLRALRALPEPAEAKAIREIASLSRHRMAAELGVNPRSIRRWEDGVAVPRGAARIAYARLLDELRRELGL